MRINRIELQNYRQFPHIDISFEEGRASDLHILIGRNTAGKTNFLNAVNWCLYGDEPHVSSHKPGLPIPNMIAIRQTLDGEDISVVVRITVKDEDRGLCVFHREQIFRVHDGIPTPQSTRFYSTYPDADGNSVILEGDDANEYAQRFVPKAIREFFFFDGERLDSYFRQEAGQKIRHAVFQIAQIDLLDRVKRKLKELQEALEKEAADISPVLEQIRNTLEKVKGDESELRRRVNECVEQLHKAESEAANYTRLLAEMPDVVKLESEREALINRVKELQGKLSEAESERGEVLYLYGVQLNVHKAISTAVTVIDEQREAGRIPPAVTSEILDVSLNEGRCAVCGTCLTDDARIQVVKLLEQIRFSSEVAKELHRIEGPLRMIAEQVHQFGKRIRTVTDHTETIKQQVSEALRRREEIDRELTGYNIDEVRHWASSRQEFEKQIRELRENLGVLKDGFARKSEEVQKNQDRLDKELKAEEKARDIREEIKFCAAAREAASKAELAIVTKTRSWIEQKTCDIYMSLVSRSKTYAGLRIDDNYNVSLEHSMGYDALGTLAASERQLLALAFTLALHEVSGFEGPLLIDTPVARVSDAQRENFAKALLEVGTAGKQVLLLFTPAEYSRDISKWIENPSASRRELKLQQNEQETKVEDLTNG